MSTQIIRTEKRVRGRVGKIVKWLFILFNVLMLIWLVTSCVGMSEVATQAETEAEQAGVAVGSALGVGVILFVWAAGDVILGLAALLTRGKTIITEEAR